MSIHFKKDNKIIQINTENSMYQMQIDKYDRLIHLYYGKNTGDDDLDYLIQKYDRGFSPNPNEAGNDRTYSLDVLPQEYTGTDNGDYRICCLEVCNKNGNRQVDLKYKSHKIYNGKYSLNGLPALFDHKGNTQTLEILMQDDVIGLEVKLLYGVFEKEDVITRSVIIKNHSKENVQIDKILSANLDFSYGDFDIINFTGRHTMERQMQRSKVTQGIYQIGSIRGTSSHQQNPFGILCERNASETYGDCYGLSFLYSGNFIMEVEQDQFFQTRMTMGIHPHDFSFILESEQEFIAPEVVMSYSSCGFEKLSHNYHKIFRENLCRSNYINKRPPILVNNWEATYFDFTGEKLIEIAKQAKELGIEMLVMDDGWFGKRDDDNSGLGDWFVNEEKLGCSLSEFVNQINKIGLKFGLWFELEMVSEDSCLYREHPEWCLTVPGRKPFRGRNQLVLDMGRKDVQEYIKKCFFDIMDQANIEYVKLDMNRSIGNVYANDLPAQRQGEVLHRYVLGLYNVLNAIVERYPDLLIESCSGGGGRFDAGMLYYAPQAWCSDNTDAIDRIKIQYGSSFGYPISSVGSHVSVCPNEQTGRTVPIETRGAVAMAGTFGYELDLTQMNDEDKEAVKIQIEQYKKYADIIRQGQYYRITNPMENTEFAAWEFVSEEKNQALMFYTALNSNSNGRVHLLKFKGLDPEKIYVIEGNTRKYYGKTLMYAGIPVPMRVKEYETMTFYVKEALL